MPTTVLPPPQNIILTLPSSKGDKGDTGPQGPQGIQGASGQAANWRGNWSSVTVYSINDGVFYNGNSYIGLGSNVNKPPDTNPGFWQIVANQGVQGITGATGPQGNPGVDSFTTTTAASTVPAPGATVQIAVVNAAWIVIGQFVWIAGTGASGGGGSFQVTAKSSNLVTFLNPSQPAATGSPVNGTSIAGGVMVSSGGAQGATGLQGDSLPIGAIYMFGSTTPPNGSLICDGTGYPTSSYPALFTIFGYTFGGSGGTFKVPDLRSRFPIGAGSGPGLTAQTIGAIGGEEKHALSTGELAAHNHSASQGDHWHVLQNNGSHAHSATMPDHVHALPPFTHNHGDPGHAHGIGYHSTIGVPGMSGGYNVWWYNASGNWATAGAGTGIQAYTTPLMPTYYSSQWGGQPGFATDAANVPATTTEIQTMGGVAAITVGNTGSGTAHENRPPYVGVSFCVKAFVTAVF